MPDTNSTVSTAETALTIAGQVASALPPPWGPIVAGSTGVIGDVLEYFFPSTSDSPQGPTLQQIIAAIAQQFANQAITQATDQITSTANVFVSQTQGVQTPLPTSVKEALTTDPEGIFSTLYTFLHDAVTGINQTALLEPITSMATDPGGDICPTDGNLQAAYLPAFAYGVSTYVLLATYWVALASSVDGPQTVATDDVNLNEPINLLNTTSLYGQNGWIAYATAASNAFDDLVQTRLADVGVAIPFSWHADTLPYESEFGVYFQDSGEPVPGFDPGGLSFTGDISTEDGVMQGQIGWPGNLPLSQPDAENVVFAVYNPNNTQAQTDGVDGLRNNYINLLQQALYNNYFDPSQMTTTIQDWTTSLNRLQTAEGGE